MGEPGRPRHVGTWSECSARSLGNVQWRVGRRRRCERFVRHQRVLDQSACSRAQPSPKSAGSRLYAWVTTLYLVGSVVAATSVNAMLLRIGRALVISVGIGCLRRRQLICAAAPSMEVLIAGRTFQGVAGGLLAGLGYALINADAAAVAVDARLRAGVGDVGSRHVGRARDGRPFRAVGAVALGVWRDGDTDHADGAAGSGWCCPGRGRSRAIGDARTKVPVWSLLLMGAAALRSASPRSRTTSRRPPGCSPPER